MSYDPNNLLVWLDLETTGLDPHRCAIIQMGMIITDNDLNELDAREWTIAPDEKSSVFWEDGARKMHMVTGLYPKVDASMGCSPAGAVYLALSFLDEYFPIGFRPMLAGNSVHFDRQFLQYSSGGAFAELARQFFHRHYDASAVMEWARRTMKVSPRWSRQKGTERPHTALADLHETLADLRLLRDDMQRTVFLKPDCGPPVVEVAELAQVVNNAFAPTGHAGERLAALIAECGALTDDKAEMWRHLERMTRGIGKVDNFVREKMRAK